MKTTNIKEKISTIVLCGGKGKRLYPLTKKIPKPLVKIRNKEILGYILEHLFSYKINDIILATGYKSQSFVKFKSKLKNKNKVKVFNTGNNNDIISRILKCEKICKEYVLICYGDTLVNLNIDRLINFFKKNEKKIAISSYNFRSQFGLMKITKSGNVISFMEKPNLGLYFNIGFFLLKRENFKFLRKFKSFQKFLESKNSQSVLRGYIHKGSHITVNTINELSLAEKKLNRMVKNER